MVYIVTTVPEEVFISKVNTRNRRTGAYGTDADQLNPKYKVHKKNQLGSSGPKIREGTKAGTFSSSFQENTQHLL